MTKRAIKKLQKLIQALKNLRVTLHELFMYLFTI